MATDGAAREETANFNSNFPVKTQRVEAEQADHTPKVSAVKNRWRWESAALQPGFCLQFQNFKTNTNKITDNLVFTSKKSSSSDQQQVETFFP